MMTSNRNRMEIKKPWHQQINRFQEYWILTTRDYGNFDHDYDYDHEQEQERSILQSVARKESGERRARIAARTGFG